MATRVVSVAICSHCAGLWFEQKVIVRFSQVD